LNRFGWRATREIEEDEEDPEILRGCGLPSFFS
jgi:hypothetical protein